jgi:hypothetical protein
LAWLSRVAAKPQTRDLDAGREHLAPGTTPPMTPQATRSSDESRRSIFNVEATLAPSDPLHGSLEDAENVFVFLWQALESLTMFALKYSP